MDMVQLQVSSPEVPCAEVVTGGPSTSYVLEVIRDFPLRLDTELFRCYPAMKLGQSPEVEFYSRQLYAMAKKLLQNGPKQSWVITAPAYFELPAAANLLARDVFCLLQSQAFNITLLELRYKQKKLAFSSEEAFKESHDYAKNDLAQRISERQRLQSMLKTDNLKSGLEGRSVIIINDINVTGTQQRFMQNVFNRFNAAECHWLYIFSVDPKLAECHPEIEYQLNSSTINNLDSFANVLINDKTRHTARSISRLFNESVDNFRYVLDSLDEKALELIENLANQEGRFAGPVFEEKMQVLASMLETIRPVK